MRARPVADGVWWVGAIDPDRTLFDALVPLPQGTSYNAWLVRGSGGTALVDTVEPRFQPVLETRLAALGADPDWIVANHAEQDHSGSLPWAAARFPKARIVATPKGRKILEEHLDLPGDRFHEVEDGATLSLGDRTLQFLHAPWVHWPETMLTWLPEQRVLFPCDLFGSHVASRAPFASAVPGVLEEARRYYASIMMPFSGAIRKHVARVEALEPALVAPSHGPAWDEPGRIVGAYRQWVEGSQAPRVVIAWVSMHESTRRLVEHLEEELQDLGVPVESHNLEFTDLGRLAGALVDASALVVGTPTVLGGAHPLVVSAAYVMNALKPRVRQVAVVGSFGWGGKTADQVAELLAGLKAEVLPPVMVRGLPREDDLRRVDALARSLSQNH